MNTSEMFGNGIKGSFIIDGDLLFSFDEAFFILILIDFIQ